MEEEFSKTNPIEVDYVTIVDCRYEQASMWMESLDLIVDREEYRCMMNSLDQNVWNVYGMNGRMRVLVAIVMRTAGKRYELIKEQRRRFPSESGLRNHYSPFWMQKGHRSFHRATLMRKEVTKSVTSRELVHWLR